MYRLDKRLRLTAGSVGLESPVVGAGEQTGAAPVTAPTTATGLEGIGVAMAGTTSRSCDPPANCMVESGSERQSPEFSRDTNMPGSRVSMCVRLFDRPCKIQRKVGSPTCAKSVQWRVETNMFHRSNYTFKWFGAN